MKPFFLTGLPRSRTAWLANFFTWGESHCHHDALRLGPDLATLRDQLQGTEAAYVGDSDSGLVALAGEIVAAYPSARWVLVERPLAEALTDFQAYFSRHPYPGIPAMSDAEARRIFEWCAARCAELPKVVPADRLLVTSAAALDDEVEMRRVWEWCLPLPFPARRWRMLDTFNVAVISGKIHAPGFAPRAA